MRKLLSAISALSWAGLATWVLASSPGNGDKVFLVCVGVAALMGVAAAVFTFIARRTFVIAFALVLATVFAVPSVPGTFLQLSLSIGDMPHTPILSWLGAVDLAILVVLPIAWAYQLRRHLRYVAAERLTMRCSQPLAGVRPSFL